MDLTPAEVQSIKSQMLQLSVPHSGLRNLDEQVTGRLVVRVRKLPKDTTFVLG